jgi:tetratricopeptide (TPR) repeat protein
MAGLQDTAEQIRALIHANAPSLDATVKSLPDEAVVAAGPVAIVLILIILFMIMGMLGGGKKKAKRSIIEDDDDEADLPRPGVSRPPPAAARPELKVVETKAPDRRADTVLEILARARPANEESASRELALAQEEAAQRVVKESASAKLFLAGDLMQAFPKLAEEARTAKAPAKAAQTFRDLGALATGVDNGLALRAYEDAFAIEKDNFWGAVFLARLRAGAEKHAEALQAAGAANTAAKGPREKTVGAAELGDALLQAGQLDKARSSYQAAVDSARTLARSGARDAQHDLSVCINKLGDLEMVAKNPDKAKALYEEDLMIARHLAKASPQSIEAQRDVIITLCKLAEATQDKRHWTEARDAVEALARQGKWPQADAWMLEALRKQAG